eukprot:257532-Chlamydomonas_euryale.AAC.2
MENANTTPAFPLPRPLLAAQAIEERLANVERRMKQVEGALSSLLAASDSTQLSAALRTFGAAATASTSPASVALTGLLTHDQRRAARVVQSRPDAPPDALPGTRLDARLDSQRSAPASAHARSGGADPGQAAHAAASFGAPERDGSLTGRSATSAPFVPRSEAATASQSLAPVGSAAWQAKVRRA